MKEEFEKIFQDAESGAQTGKPEAVIDLFADLKVQADPQAQADAEELAARIDEYIEERTEENAESPADEVPEPEAVPEPSEISPAAVSTPHVAATRLERNSKKGRKASKPEFKYQRTEEKPEVLPADETDEDMEADEDTGDEEFVASNEKPSKGKKNSVSMTAIIAAAAAFLIILFVFVLDTRTEEDTGKTVTIAEYVVNEITGKTFMGQAEERLSRDMVPISVDEDSPLYEKFKSADRVNVLVLGVNGNMTDTIMLGSYDMSNQQVDIISVPRDTYYYRSEYGKYTAYQKINSVWRTDGTAALATAVSDLLDGMPIHYYVIVEYDDIRAVMKSIGGVEINVPFHMKYEDTTPGLELHIDIPGGKQVIDESNVIEFLRFRHTNPSFAAQGYKSYPGGDIQRIQVQQEFVKAVIKKCCKLGNILDVAKVILTNVDSDLDIGTAAKVAAKVLSGFSTENMESYTLPGTDFTNELSFWKVNKEETTALVEKIYGVEVTEDGQIILNIEPGSRIRFVGIPQIEENTDSN